MNQNITTIKGDGSITNSLGTTTTSSGMTVTVDTGYSPNLEVYRSVKFEEPTKQLEFTFNEGKN